MYIMYSQTLEVICVDGVKKIRIKCNYEDFIDDLKELIAEETGTPANKIVLKKSFMTFLDHVKLRDCEIYDGMEIELYYK